MCLFQFWVPQGICLGVGLLGHMVVLFLVFKGISIPSSIVVVSIYIPTNSTRVGLFSPPSPSLVCRLFDDAHSDRCEVVSHCSFDLHFSNAITSWQTDGETVETMADLIFLGSKITVDGDCSHEIKRHLPRERKVITKLNSTLKSRDYFANNVWSSQGYGFSSSYVWI